MATNDGLGTPEFPLLVLGISLDQPGFRIAENARGIYASLAERGHPTGLMVADRAYIAGGTADGLAPALRAMGYGIVTDYKANQLGVMESYEGAQQVEGHWYCPTMPPNLVSASLDHRERTIDSVTYFKRLAARDRYRFVPNGKPDANGFVQLKHPKVNGRRVCNPNRDHAPKSCTQDSLVFPPEAGAKLAQTLPYGTLEWLRMYSGPRNTIEGFNAYLKDDGRTALHQPGRRRLRGYTAQYVLTTMLVVAANLRKVMDFVQVEAAVQNGTKVRTRAPRRSQAYRHFKVASVSPDSIVDDFFVEEDDEPEAA